MKVYVGNLSKETTEPQLNDVVVPFGKPESLEIVFDKNTGASRGFAFIEFISADEANAAITGLNGKELNGNVLRVNESKPKTGAHSTPRTTTVIGQ